MSKDPRKGVYDYFTEEELRDAYANMTIFSDAVANAFFSDIFTTQHIIRAVIEQDDLTALISVAIDHPKFNDGFVAAVKDNRHIAECLYIAGEFDYFLKVVTDNTKTLESVLNEIKSIPGVSKTQTSIVLSSPKNEYSVPIKAKKEK